MTVSYVKKISSGHQYTVSLFPISCNLSEEFVKAFFGLSTLVENNFVFSKEITKTSNNTYLLTIKTISALMDPVPMEANLEHLSDNLTVPKTFVPSPVVEALAEVAPTTQTVFTGVVVGSLIGTVSLGATAGLWSILRFQQLVGYFIYINIEYPPQTEVFLSMLTSSIWDSLPNPLASITEPLSSGFLSTANLDVLYESPRKFEYFNKTSFFIENGGSIIVMNLTLLLLLPLIGMIQRIPKMRNSIILKKIKAYLKWGVIIRMFLENGIPLSLAVFLQLRIFGFTNIAYIIISVILALITFFYQLIMTWFILRVRNKRNNTQLQSNFAQKSILGPSMKA